MEIAQCKLSLGGTEVAVILGFTYDIRHQSQYESEWEICLLYSQGLPDNLSFDANNQILL